MRIDLVAALSLYAGLAGCIGPEQPRAYAHVLITHSQVDSETSDLPGYGEDETQIGFVAGGGYHVTDFAAVELAYDNVGRFDWSSDDGSDFGAYRVQGALLTGFFHCPVWGPLEVTARVGGFGYRQSSWDNGQGRNTDTGVAAVYGLGLQAKVWRNLALRAEWFQLQEVDDYPFDQIGIGATWTF